MASGFRFGLTGSHGTEAIRARLFSTTTKHRDSKRSALRKAGSSGLVEALTSAVELDGHHLTLEAIEAVSAGAPVRIAAAARERVARARAFVEERFASGEAIYGVTTGFGRLASISIDPADAVALQLNLVRSHAAGTGRAARDSSRARRRRTAGELALGRTLRRQARDARSDRRDARARRDAGRAVPGLGRRERRSRAARAYDAHANRRRRSVLPRRAASQRASL